MPSLRKIMQTLPQNSPFGFFMYETLQDIRWPTQLISLLLKLKFRFPIPICIWWLIKCMLWDLHDWSQMCLLLKQPLSVLHLKRSGASVNILWPLFGQREIRTIIFNLHQAKADFYVSLSSRKPEFTHHIRNRKPPPPFTLGFLNTNILNNILGIKPQLYLYTNLN